MLSLVAADELVGFLALRFPDGRRMDAEEREIAASMAGQTAVAIKKVELIERLNERNAIKDLLEDWPAPTRRPTSSPTGRARWAAIWAAGTW